MDRPPSTGTMLHDAYAEVRGSKLALTDAGRASATYAGSGPTRTSCLPKLAPLSSPMNAPGALSSPSVTNSRYLTLPSPTHCDMTRGEIADDEAPDRQALGQHRAHHR